MAIAIFSIASFTARAQVVLFTEGFETDGEGSRYTSNTFSFCSGVPGNNPDYFLRTNTNPVLPSGCTIGFTDVLTNLQGSFFWASEDIRSSSPVPNINPPGQITTQTINISGYNSLTVSLFLATSSNNNIRWETSDSINIQVSINGGSFFTVGRFMGDAVVGGRLRIDGNLDGAITAADPVTTCDQLNFTKYTFSIPGSGNSLQVRLDYDQIGGTEELAIDQLQVSGVSVLPVKLIYFNAVKSNTGVVKLNWKVAENSDATIFDIEKSNNGIEFSLLERMRAGTETLYSATDTASTTTLAQFYRLKMIDSRGGIIYSPVVKVSKSLSVFKMRTISPVLPGRPSTVVFASAEKITGNISLWDVEGKMMMQRSSTVYPGQTVISLPVDHFPAGLYIIRFTSATRVISAAGRFIKQ